MNKKYLILLFVVLSLFISVILPQNASASSGVIFQDDFTETNNTFPSKWILANDPNNNPCDVSWKVINGMVGIDINNELFCTTNITPKDELWEDIQGDYKINADIKFINGTDHNLAFSFVPQESLNSFYEIHFLSPGDFVLSGTPAGFYNTFISNNYPNNNTYHIEIIVSGKNIRVSINGNLMRDFTSNTELQNGKIALRAGTGADPNSETWFDNITVTEFNDDPTLDVPLLMQVDQDWSNDAYDHINTTIADSGCAMVSTAMVLKYYGINKLPDNTDLDPGSLNNWLKTHNGYLRNGSIKWNAISNISSTELYPTIKQLNPNYEFNGLEYDHNTSAADERVLNDLENEMPVILNVNNRGHFVVATGVNNDIFTVNDPLYSTSKLLTENYNGEYQSIRRYVPSYTDLSYIVLAIDENINITVKDNEGNEIGRQEIEQPVKNINGNIEFVSYPLKTVYIPKPESGEYTVTLSSNSTDNYLLDIYSYDVDGKLNQNSINGLVNTQADTFKINFDKNNSDNSTSSKEVTFQSTISDVNEAIKLKLINKGVGQSIISQLKNAEKDVKKNKIWVAKLKLDIANKLLNNLKNHKIIISSEAYNILSYDIRQLKAAL